jgi:hypothetical protein
MANQAVVAGAPLNDLYTANCVTISVSIRAYRTARSVNLNRHTNTIISVAENIYASAAINKVMARTANQRVITRAATERIIARTTADKAVIAAFANQEIVARITN